MRNLIVSAVVASICMLSGLKMATVPEDKGIESRLPYDRVQVLVGFLGAAYPDLRHRLAVLTIDSTFEGEQSVTIRSFRLYPCRPATNVTAGTADGVNLSKRGDRNATLPPGPPRCGEEPTFEYQHFLDVSLDLGAGHKRRPIFKFVASGKYVDAKLQELREQFAGKAYPTDIEAIRDLVSKQPKYGPDNRVGLIAGLPLQGLYDITGCRLNPDTARFLVELEDPPQHLPPDLQWHLQGTAAAKNTLTTAECSASFEPFEGHLTAFYD